MHNVQHVEKVKPYRAPLPGQNPGLNRPPPLSWAEGNPELEVEAIIDHRVVTRGQKEVKQFKVLWRGYGPEEATWEPRSNLSCGRKLREYLRSKSLPAQPEPESESASELDD